MAALLGARDTCLVTLPPAGYSRRVARVVDLAGDVGLAAYQQPPAWHEVTALLGWTCQEGPERSRDASSLAPITP